MFLGFASPQLSPELVRISVKENLDQRQLMVNAVLRVLSGSLRALFGRDVLSEWGVGVWSLRDRLNSARAGPLAAPKFIEESS